MKEIRGIKESKLWAVFAPDGYIQVRTISDTRKDAREKAIAHWERGVKTWKDYAVAGYTAHKILVDIKIS